MPVKPSLASQESEVLPRQEHRVQILIRQQLLQGLKNMANTGKKRSGGRTAEPERTLEGGKQITIQFKDRQRKEVMELVLFNASLKPPDRGGSADQACVLHVYLNRPSTRRWRDAEIEISGSIRPVRTVMGHMEIDKEDGNFSIVPAASSCNIAVAHPIEMPVGNEGSPSPQSIICRRGKVMVCVTPRAASATSKEITLGFSVIADGNWVVIGPSTDYRRPIPPPIAKPRPAKTG